MTSSLCHGKNAKVVYGLVVLDAGTRLDWSLAEDEIWH